MFQWTPALHRTACSAPSPRARQSPQAAAVGLSGAVECGWHRRRSPSPQTPGQPWRRAPGRLPNCFLLTSVLDLEAANKRVLQCQLLPCTGPGWGAAAGPWADRGAHRSHRVPGDGGHRPDCCGLAAALRAFLGERPRVILGMGREAWEHLVTLESWLGAQGLSPGSVPGIELGARCMHGECPTHCAWSAACRVSALLMC